MEILLLHQGFFAVCLGRFLGVVLVFVLSCLICTATWEDCLWNSTLFCFLSIKIFKDKVKIIHFYEIAEIENNKSMYLLMLKYILSKNIKKLNLFLSKEYFGDRYKPEIIRKWGLTKTTQEISYRDKETFTFTRNTVRLYVHIWRNH